MKKRLNGRKIGKSTLALLIAVLMIATALPMSALAAPRPGNGPVIAEPMRTALDMAYPGQVAADYPGKNDQGYVQLQKKAGWTDPVAKTHGTVEFVLSGTPVAGQGMDAVLVLDKSGSMGSDSRWVNAVQAAKDFIDLMFEPTLIGPSPNRISIALFDTAGQSIGQFYDHTGKQTLKNYIDGKSAGGGTNYGAGLNQAEALFNDPQSRTRDKVVVFMSDGDPNNPNDETAGVTASNRLKNAGVKIYSIGFGVPAGGNAEMYTKNLASDPKQDHYKLVSKSTELAGYFAALANTMKLAGTNAVITDQINLDNFAIDPTRDITVDGVKATAGVSVDVANQKITWTAGDILNTPKVLSIPVVLDQKYWKTRGVFDTNENDAIITYVNHRDVASRKKVPSPALARPYAGVQRVYYEVNDVGEPVDTGGTVLATQAEFENYMVQLGVTGSSEPKGSQVTVTAEEKIAYVNASGQTEYYKYFEGATFSSTPTGKDVSFTIMDDEKNYVVYFGYRKLRSKEMTMTKTYNPTVAGAPSASFKIQNVTLNETEMDWTAASTDVYKKTMPEDHIFRVKEEKANGYTPVDPFYVKFDGAKVVTCDVTGAPKTYTGVTTNGMSVTVVNKKDDTAQKEISYKVEYYKDGKLDSASTQTVRKMVWVHETHIDVDASKINITNKFPGYKFNSPASPIPAKAADNEVIKIYYIPDTTLAHDVQYTVVYFLDNEFEEMDVVKDSVWIHDNTLATQPVKIFPGYKLVSTDPDPMPSRMDNNGTLLVFYEKDPDQKKKINFTVEYFKDGIPAGTFPEEREIWVGDDTVSLKKEDWVDNKFPGFMLEKATINDARKPFPVKVAHGETLKLYFKTDTRTRPISFNIIYEFEENGVKQELRRESVIKNVPLTQTENSVIIEQSDIDLSMYPYYKIKNLSRPIGQTIDQWATLLVTLEKDLSQRKNITYHVHHYKNNVLDKDDAKTTDIFVGDRHVTLNNSQLLSLVETFPGYKLKTDLSSITELDVPDGGVIKLFYESDMSQADEYIYYAEYYAEDKNGTITKVGKRLEIEKRKVLPFEDDFSITFNAIKPLMKDATDPDINIGFPSNDAHLYAFNRIETNHENLNRTSPEVDTSAHTVVIKLVYKEQKPYDIPIDGLVTLKGKGMQQGEFKFEIKDSNGNQVATGENTPSGIIKFTTTRPITGAMFDKQFTYQVKQTGVGSSFPAARYILDSRSFSVTVKVTYDTVKAEPVFTIVNYSAPIKFNNSYKGR